MTAIFATVAICFAVFHAVSTALVGGLGTSAPRTPPVAHLKRRVAGLVLLGLVPAAVAAMVLPGGLGGVGLGVGDPVRGLGGVVLLALVILPIIWTSNKQEKLQAIYPQIRSDVWTPGLYAKSAVTWALYLLGYEFLFRGFLLFGLVEPLGLWPAIWLNTALYVAAHADKDSQEVLGCVPMGLLFCGLAWWSGAIWAPLALHVLIALTGETSALVHSPGVRWAASEGARAGSGR